MKWCKALTCCLLAAVGLTAAANGQQVVISQIYGAGSSTGATWRNDFVELFNRGSTAVDLSGWSVQYNGATSTGAWNVHSIPANTPLLQPGQYFLLQESGGTTNGLVLPVTPDLTGSLSLAATAGKVALVNNTTALTGGSPTGVQIIDLVGFGTGATAFEGSGPVAGPGAGNDNTTSFVRAAAGCMDANDNATDLAPVSPSPSPRNSLTPQAPCSPLTTGACCDAFLGLCVQRVASGCTSTFLPASTTCSPNPCTQPTGACCNGLVCTTGAADACTGGGVFLGAATTCTTSACQPGSIVISQIYGAGGNSGAVLKNDFVELFNRGGLPISVAGWSVQYASNTGSSWTVTALGNKTIYPGRYLLIALAGGSTGSALPAADVTGTTDMSGSNGKVALVNTTTALTTTAATGATIVDFVGFGSATTFEGSGPTPAISATTAAMRTNGGCVDTNINSADFSALTPTPRNSASAVHQCSADAPPSGVGSVATDNVCPGTTAMFTFTVTPGSPANSIMSVVGDATAINAGVGASISFSNSGGNVWTGSFPIAPSTTSGVKIVGITITENGGRTGMGSISMTLTNCTLGITAPSVSPNAVCSGTPVTFNLTVRKNTIPGQGPSTGISVKLDLTQANNFVSLTDQPMTDLGDDPMDPTRRLFTLTHVVPAGQLSGTASIPITLTDMQGNLFNGTGVVPGPYNVNLVGPCTDAASDVVVSQVYGGGGNAGATYKNDFIEIFNRGASAVSIAGWSVQYASATSMTWQVTPIGTGSVTSLAPGQYYLVQQDAGTGGTVNLPAPDATGTISMSASDGKVAVVSSITAITSPTAPEVKDFVGFGSADSSEGVFKAPALSNTNSDFRRADGCQDNNQNGADFLSAAAAPRNSGSALHSCSAPSTVTCCRGATCQVNVAAGDCVSNAVVTAQVIAASCTGNTVAGCCFSDFNKNGHTTIDDIFIYLNAWFAASVYADISTNGANAPSIDDIFIFLNAWFTPCPGT